MISTFIFSTFLYPTLDYNSFSIPQNFYGIQSPSLGIPVIFSQIVNYYMIAVGIFLLVYFLYRKIKYKQKIHPIVFLPIVTQFVWLE